MKKYEAPEIEVIHFEVEDVITASGVEVGENETPPFVRP